MSVGLFWTLMKMQLLFCALHAMPRSCLLRLILFFFLPCLVVDNFARPFTFLALFSLSLEKCKHRRSDRHAIVTVVDLDKRR